MKFNTFSPKQMKALTWWCNESAHKNSDAIICDGAVRSGKTLCLSLSFVAWAFAYYEQKSFAICGKTVTSLRRNLIVPLLETLGGLGFNCSQKVSQSYIDIEYKGKKNRFYMFGGKDEGSAALIQGITLAGVLMDEVALMPRSFVEQALARCSVTGSKFWFNCNPQHPHHWFYTEWICKATEKNAYYLHFVMKDNPSLSAKILKRYTSLYSGVFYERYVLGKWVAAHGAVYPMFDENVHVVEQVPDCSRYIISCDYGTVNPSSFGLWGFCDGVWYRIREYYHCSRTTGVLKTDEEYCDALEHLAQGITPEIVLVDPSAASFIQCIRKRGNLKVKPAKNDVLDGIRTVCVALKEGNIRIHQSCKDCRREFALYRWNMNSPHDLPIAENDHAMDEMRYFATHVFGQTDSGFFALSSSR